MATKLETKTAEITEKRNRLAGMFETAKSAEGLTFTAAQIDEVKTLNKELDAIGKDVHELRALDEIETKNRAELEALNTPNRDVPFPGAGGGGRQRSGSLETKNMGRDGFDHNSGMEYARPDLGKLFIESKSFTDRLKQGAGRWQSGNQLSIRLEDIETKTLFQESAGWSPFVPRIPRVQMSPQQQPRIVDLFPTGTVNTSAIKYMLETTYTNAAAGTLEGGTFAESALALTEQTQNVIKIATFLPVTDEQMEDVEQARDYINNRLSLMMEQTLDKELFSGSGTAPHLLGITNVPSIQTGGLVSGDATTDGLLKAMVAVQTIGFCEPSAILMNPLDWMAVRLLKTTDGLYIWGHPSTVGPSTMWGLPVVSSTYVTQGEAVVGDYRGQSQLFHRRGLEFLVSNSHANFFIQGQQAIRCDMRCVLVVYRPQGFYVLTGLPSVTL